MMHVKTRQNENEKRRILIVEDEAINREMLAMVLQDQYELRMAETGEAAWKEIRENARSLSLVLLDLNLPDLSGMEILNRMKREEMLEHLPVIVLTADRNAEVESLMIGAMDFIPKPYPMPEVILARVWRTIELSEGRIIIGQTERDSLTGLYNRDFFYRYAEQIDARHEETAMDAIVININHFHMINERYGRPYGDGVLRRIGENVQRLVSEGIGIACRRESDTFLVYCPHRSDYTEMLDKASDNAAGEGKDENVVRLRMGVYPRVDKTIDMERRFDRAKLAVDTVRSTFTKAVAIYDNALHESAIFAEQLLIDFPKAIEGEQFQVYYQPKYDIRGEEPSLSSAEALVRWNHPEFGMISPGVFIPLFEKNGLIQKLDYYVWRAAARQIREWKDRLGVSVPVSVNVSRVDMFDENIVNSINELIASNGLEQGDLLLEVTESAYTEDSEYIIRTVENFREAGFFIEMDDFGSGYSSLNMLTNLPVDALKLDMQFVRSAFKNGKNTRLLEIVIDIAESISVPVIAEGVETAEQMFTLKTMGCDIAQGYYFSKPVPADQFEPFLTARKDCDTPESLDARKEMRRFPHDRHAYDAMHDPLTGLYNFTAFDMLLHDADTGHTALLLAELDDYEALRKAYGREGMEKALLRVAGTLRNYFRSSDFICRIRENEFAVILPRVNSEQRDVIQEKIGKVRDEIRNGAEGMQLSLSVALAFGNREKPQTDIYEEANKSLARARLSGRNGRSDG